MDADRDEVGTPRKDWDDDRKYDDDSKWRRRSRSRSPPRRRSRSPERRRSRSPYRERERDRPERRDREYDDRDRDRHRGDRDRETRDRGDRRSGGFDRRVDRETAANEAAKRSQKENRVYVGNLSFKVRWNDLKDFMRDAGEVVFSEVLTLPNGQSKGCGVVEYATRDGAERAIADLNEKPLLGRNVYIREDREEEPRFGSAAVSAPRPGGGGFGDRPSGRGFGPSGGGFGSSNQQPSKWLFVSGVPNIDWRDLKDKFREAGESIVRADIVIDAQGNSKGNAVVMYENPADAANAIAMFDGWEGDQNGVPFKLSVRYDRLNGQRPGGGFAGRGGFSGGGGRGGFVGTNPVGPGGVPGPHRGMGSYAHLNIQPSQQIFVKNLPWSTSNEDLIELFQTTGKVEEAEVLFQDGRSKGCGIVQFATVEEADTAIAKFQGYSYGGRPLSLEYNGRFKEFGGGGGAADAGGGNGAYDDNYGNGLVGGEGAGWTDDAPKMDE